MLKTLVALGFVGVSLLGAEVHAAPRRAKNRTFFSARPGIPPVFAQDGASQGPTATSSTSLASYSRWGTAISTRQRSVSISRCR